MPERSIAILSIFTEGECPVYYLYLGLEEQCLRTIKGRVRRFTTLSGARGVRSLIERGLVPFRMR